MENWILRADLQWEHCGFQSLLYQIASGETHFLNPLGVAILEQLEADPSQLDQLCEYLSMKFGVAPDEDLRRQVAASLARFDELGLIEHQPKDETTA